MKKLFTLALIAAFDMMLFAQAPQKLSYQAVIRNSTGGLVTNHAVGMKISILQGSSSGTAVYVETQTPITNANGLATIEIGGGTLVSGNFSTINWDSGTYYLKTETDPAGGTSYTIAGTSQLLSVPYALHAKTVQTGDNWGTQLTVTDETLTGNGTTASPLKLSQMGASVGQVLKWTGTTWDNASDNNGLWIDGAEGLYYNGGKNVGIGTGSPKYKLSVADGSSSCLINIQNSITGNSLADGLTLGMLSAEGYMYNKENSKLHLGTNNLTRITILANGDVGIGITEPTRELTIYNSENTASYLNLQNTTTGKATSDGLIMGITGVHAMLSNLENGNLYIGTYGSTAMTVEPGGAIGIGTTTPDYKLDVVGQINLNKGISSGVALRCNGAEALWYNGRYFSWGYGGTYNFFGDKIKIGGDGDLESAYMLYVGGNAFTTGVWATSDARMKKNISTLENALNNLLKIRGTSFEYRDKEFIDYEFARGRQFGLIAQEIEAIFPELVNTDSKGYKSVNYNGMIPVFVEAFKDQQRIIDQVKSENEELKVRLERLEAKVGK